MVWQGKTANWYIFKETKETNFKGQERILSNHILFSVKLESELRPPKLSPRLQKVCSKGLCPQTAGFVLEVPMLPLLLSAYCC